MAIIGLAGKPNVGKSTLFSAATLATVPIANYPFTTRTANIGITYVTANCVCRELKVQDNPVRAPCKDGVRFIPIKLIDCPGLVRGASKGRGLGNQFLDEVRRADVIILVLDLAGATDEEGRPCTPGANDPLKDVEFLEEEFDMWIYQIIMKDWDKLSRRTETLKENIQHLLSEKLAGLQIKKHFISQAIEAVDLHTKKPTAWSDEDLKGLAAKLRRISKPMVLAANKIDMPCAEANLERLKTLGYPTIPCCAEGELALRRAAEKSLIEYNPGKSSFTILTPDKLNEKQILGLNNLREKVLDKYGSTGIQQTINHALFKVLNAITVYPVEDENKLADHEGNILPDCYLVPQGTTAKEFAMMIHTDLGENFLYAVETRTKKHLSEDYLIKDRDVVKIVSTKSRA